MILMMVNSLTLKLLWSITMGYYYNTSTVSLTMSFNLHPLIPYWTSIVMSRKSELGLEIEQNSTCLLTVHHLWPIRMWPRRWNRYCLSITGSMRMPQAHKTGRLCWSERPRNVTRSCKPSNKLNSSAKCWWSVTNVYAKSNPTLSTWIRSWRSWALWSRNRAKT